MKSLYEKFLECRSVAIDSRKVGEGDLFFCLKGPNFDANIFAEVAISKGAKYVVMDNKEFYDSNNSQMILVEDSLECLQQLSNYHRRQLNTIVIGLTGSNGKTTTKELIHEVFKTKYNTIATIGNLNNHIGVPLTLLRMCKDTEIAIVEMGANHQKEIHFLCSLAEPNYGYITNFGKAHLEGFGGEEGVIKGKSELYDYLIKNKKKGFVRIDDILQAKQSEGLDTITFSIDKSFKADFSYEIIKSKMFISLKSDQGEIQSNLIGLYNGINISAAVTIGLYFGIGFEDVKKAIENYSPTNNRSQWLSLGANDILLDAYNANPSSMSLAIQSFIEVQKPNKLMILGDMFEMGKYAFEEHKKIVDLVSESKIKTFFVGEEFCKCQREHSKLTFCKSISDLKNKISFKDLKNHTLLIKGSRGMALEKLIDE